MIVGQIARDQITSNRRSKPRSSDCLLCGPSIPSGRPNERLATMLVASTFAKLLIQREKSHKTNSDI